MPAGTASSLRGYYPQLQRPENIVHFFHEVLHFRLGIARMAVLHDIALYAKPRVVSRTTG